MNAPEPSPAARQRRFFVPEATGGLLLLLATVVALTIANSPLQDTYHAIATAQFGPSTLGLHLTTAEWASDGLLAIFFFVVGIELKQEFTTGSMSKVRDAALPVLAAIGGMIAPAIVFTVLVVGFGETSALHGWPIPTATDIAFALAVLTVFGRSLPSGVRAFLLTLAVADDLLAIVVIAVFYTAHIDILAMVAALVTAGVFAALLRTRRLRWWLLLPVALIAWGFMHASGVHATIVGVVLGLCVPARPRTDEASARTVRLTNAIQPISSWIALPVFALFTAGVSVGSADALRTLTTEPVFIAVVVALVVGKFVGVLGTTMLLSRYTSLSRPQGTSWRTMLPIGFLSGIGFTVSLLIAQLSFPDTMHTDAAVLGVLTGSSISALLAVLSMRQVGRRDRRAKGIS